MRVITKKRLLEWELAFPDAKEQLQSWRKIVERSGFGNLHELRQCFPSADAVGRYTVINIKGNKYRLIVAIHYNRGRIYIRDFLTHAQYDRWSKTNR